MRCALCVFFLPQDRQPVEEEREDTALGGPSVCLVLRVKSLQGGRRADSAPTRRRVDGGLAGWIADAFTAKNRECNSNVEGCGSCPKKRLQKKGT